MSEVINLNRYRKRKAREENERRAETNRRLHGRTKAERLREAAHKQRLEKQLAGAFLVPERVPVESLVGDPEQALRHLEQATRATPTLSELSERLRARSAPKNASLPAPEQRSGARPTTEAPPTVLPDARAVTAEHELAPEPERVREESETEPAHDA